jgi:hypothetical protein
VVKPLCSFEWGVVLTGTAVVSVILAFYAVGLGQSARVVPELVTVEVNAAATPPARVVSTPPAKAKPRSTFALTAVRGESWLQIRSGSFTGRALFEGLLPLGETVRLRSKRLWIRFGAASHLDLTIDGRRTQLPAFGTFDAFAGPRGVVADRTDYATAAQSP